MTREEAKELLTHMMMSYVPKDQYGDYDDPEPYEQAIDMAIDALSADAVSREEYEELYRKAKEVNEMANDILADFPSYKELVSVANLKEEFESADAVQTDLVQRSDVLEVISDAQDGSGSTYNILQPIYVKVNNLPSCHRCYECDEQFYQQLLEKGMIELPQEYVSVVRCKDCRWYENRYGEVCHNPRYGDGHANYSPPYVDEEYFCKDGERREP